MRFSDDMKLIGATSRVVKLSDETLKKNVTRHPELLLADYQNLQAIIEKAQVIIRDSVTTLVFVKIGASTYHAAIKATQTGKALFLTSLRKTNDEEIARILKKNKANIVRNTLKEKL